MLTKFFGPNGQQLFETEKELDYEDIVQYNGATFKYSDEYLSKPPYRVFEYARIVKLTHEDIK